MTLLAAPTSFIAPQLATETTPRPNGDRPARRTSAAVGEAPGTTEHLLRVCHGLPAAHPDRGVLRARAIENNLPLAGVLARRYAGRGERLDDLVQVAALALVKAVDGYDPDRTTRFISYAVPTIIGALKRHFRDTAWGMRVPRSDQELFLELSGATGHLTHLRGRPPTFVELAEHLHVSIDALLAAARAGQAYRLPSLNASAVPDGSTELIDLIGADDPQFSGVDDHLTLRSLLAGLPLRERRILTMRFYDEMTQTRIAAEIGVSQMHVSRLLRHALDQLRAGLLTHTAGR